MVVEVKHQVCDGHMLKWLMAAGLAWLEQNQTTVNTMNVFPVPDGDTGTNMCLTMQKAYDAITHSDEAHIGFVADAVAQGALMGARGNSGVILSQLLKGFAQGVQGVAVLDLPRFVVACGQAVQVAYEAVNPPVEGTILTVAREAYEALRIYAQDNDDLLAAFEVLLSAARASLALTPELLPVLKEAGFVDSGGQGLVVILEGMSRLLHGEPVYLQPAHGIDFVEADHQHWQDALVPEDEEGYGYDVQFLIHGEALNVAQIRADIDAMGWSTLVVGDSRLIKVHVHVHDPGVPLSYAIALGAAIDDIVVENMQMQYEQYVKQRSAQQNAAHMIKPVEGVAVIAVVSGAGMQQLMMEDLGAAAVILGGQTMNPSTESFLSIIDQLPNSDIILLPNNKNVILAAEQAAALARDKNVRVVPSKTIPQGVNAMVTYISQQDAQPLETLVEEMRNSLKEIVSCEVTTAVRDVALNGVTVQQGQYIGLIDGQLRSADARLDTVIIDLLRKAGADEYELITLYYGEGVTEATAQALVEQLQHVFAGQEYHLVFGGQPLYPYLISLE